MRSAIVLGTTVSCAIAALVCEPFVPTDLGWSFNLASGYLSANRSDTSPDGSELQLDQSSPFGVDGYSFGTDYIFTLLNCTDKDLGIKSYATTQCYPASSKGHHANTTTRTDFIQIQANNNVCLTVANPNKDQSELNYVACIAKPHDLRQIFKATRTVTYPKGACGGGPADGGPDAVQVVWVETPYCKEPHHWHLRNDTDVHSEILLKKHQTSDERFVFFDEAG